VMNGPMPIMFDMFSAVASSNPNRRGRGGDAVFSDDGSAIVAMGCSRVSLKVLTRIARIITN